MAVTVALTVVAEVEVKGVVMAVPKGVAEVEMKAAWMGVVEVEVNVAVAKVAVG